jgi:hypothetical protein
VDAPSAYDTGSQCILPASWRSRPLPVAVIGAVTAVVTLAALLPVRPAPQAQPRYYVTISQSVSRAEAVVRESANGKVTGQVAIPTAVRPPASLVTGAADDRSFIIGVYQNGPAGSLDLRLFRLRITAAGRPGSLTELPWMGLPIPPEVQGIALSPDGIMLAVSLRYQVPLSADPLHYGGIEVINLVTGTTHLWMSRGWYYWPGPPSWVGGDRIVAFTWWHDIGTTGPAVLAGIRELDATAPGRDLLDSRR